VSSGAAFADIVWRDRPVRIEHLRIAPERGAAPLLVFLHEGLGSLAMWRDFPQRVCDAVGCRGLVYSRPGYGRSTPRAADERWGLDFMHRQALEVLPALFAALQIDTEAERPWFYGHSDGGSIALIHAAQRPAHTGGLVVAAPHIKVEPVSIESIQHTRGIYQRTDLRERLSRYHDDPDSAFWGWNDIWLHPQFPTWRIEAEIAAITCPVLAVQGHDDEYGTMAQIDGIAAAVPRTELFKLDACGHSPHRDRPEVLIPRIAEFMHRHAFAKNPATQIAAPH
jgi:pimeloyl-ACP methyl ester carboxylesterase